MAVLAFLGLAALWARDARAAEEDDVVLENGLVLHGRVLGPETVRKRKMLRIETDFGILRIDRNQVRTAPEQPPADGVFFFCRIRVAQVRGVVEKRAAGSAEWLPVRLREEYGPVVNAPDAIVRPGDAVRTGAGSFLDVMPHRGVWLRITEHSEVEFPAERGEASIVLVSGRTLQRIDGRPRGKTFVVRLPSRLVTVRGTEFLVEVGEQERIAVTRGEVEVERGPRIGAGRTGRWAGGGAVEEGAVTAEDREALSVEAIRLPEEDVVYIPSGKYVMGGQGEADAPKRKITLTGYLIDRREVSNEEFARFAAATGGPAPKYFVDGAPPPGQERWPAYNLTADMARSYVAWAGKRLPTEAQWEAAARGPKALAYPWGSRLSGDVKTLPYVNPTEFMGVEVERLKPVDEATPDVSPFGLVGMVSNAAEWCRDWYHDRSYTMGKDEDPQGPPGGVWRVVRGHWVTRGADGPEPRVTARKRMAEDDEDSGTGVRGVVEPD